MNSTARVLLAGLCLSVVIGCPSPMPAPDGGQTEECVVGTQGCACAAEDKCARNARGEQLLCMGGTCEAMTCVAGDRGCVCRNGLECNGAGDSCTNGFCVAAGCAPGAKDCTCLAGACDVGFTCLENTVCVDSAGFEGGACLTNGRCHKGARCDSATGTCVFCDPGTAACQCKTNNGCNAGLACSTGLCLSAQQLPPANPVCYTSCRDDLDENDGGQRECSTDNVFSGCLPNRTCTQGSCLLPGASKPGCTQDSECPFFQVCLAGGCYSNCEANADCSSGMGCFRKACRSTCNVNASAGAPCPSGYSCTANDGENGFCLPIGRTQSSQMSQTALPNGGLEIPVESLELSNVQASGSFQVLPKSAITQDVTIQKVAHTVYYADGRSERVDLKTNDAGVYLPCDVTRNECPLWWLKLQAPGQMPVQDQSVPLRLSPNCADTTRIPDAGGVAPCPVVQVSNAGGIQAVRWEGEIKVTTRDATTSVTLRYVERPEGQWTGSMYYFGTFSTKNLQGWIDAANKAQVGTVKNGLIQGWGQMRGGRLEGWQEFLAMLTATRTESWKFGTVDQRCKTNNGNQPKIACYPYTNTVGVRPFVQDTDDTPIPSGVTELPVAFNLKIDPANAAAFTGRIESSNSMHYPGNPALRIEFKGSPADAASCASGTGGNDCLVYLKENATGEANKLVSEVGGRYFPTAGTCATGFIPNAFPWLVPGFTAGTVLDQATGNRARTECRDNLLPFDQMAAASNGALNQSLAGGNPVPDGQSRRRTLRFLDGALVNQSEIFILFEESYASFIPGQPATTAYGYMLLKRAPANLTAASFVGMRPPAMPPVRTTPTPPGAQCDATLIKDALGKPTPTAITTLTQLERETLTKTLLEGSVTTAGYGAVPPTEFVHYFCEDTGLFNGGREDRGLSTDVEVACPAGSKIIYFLSNRTPAQVAAEACQTVSNGRGSCMATLNSWRAAGTIVTEENPLYECVPPPGQPRPVFCDDNRLDLRANKTFFKKLPSNTAKTLLPLRALIDAAFRYKTRFRSSTGGTLGFAPAQCVPNSDQVPYCYDPAQIEEARQRVDCLINIYSVDAYANGLSANQRTDLNAFLRKSFSEFSPTYEGFERLYAELMIMQGDESLTAAYASRFDLAATGGASFKGSAFEPNGIDLTGVAGAEMFRLYQAVQYYQLALDRLYMLGPNMSVALARGPVTSELDFISAETVTSYLERLVRAASQKSRSIGEIARRYQNFNRPDLARRTIERGYVATYLESAIISRQMLDIAAASSSASLPQIYITIEKAQRNYRMALLDMREMYAQITDEMNYFGYPPDYIPFPAIEGSSVSSANAFDTLLNLAKQRLDLAKTREQIALASGKQGRVDAAQFQSDLTGIRNNYENQLAQICGTFPGPDSRQYPAIRKYAPLSDVATAMGDPCGRMGSGELHQAMGNVKDSALRLKGVILRHENSLADIDIERTRIAEQCALNTTIADLQYQMAEKQATVAQTVAEQRALMTLISSSVQAVTSAVQVMDCEIQCASSAAMAVTVAALGVATAGSQFATEGIIIQKEADQRKYERDTMRIIANAPCQQGQIDSVAKIADLTNNLLEIQLEALRADYGMRLSMSEVKRLFSTAERLQAQQEEAEQLAINLQQAQNDPNVRIYQNDSIINADVSFRDALALAYRLTRVYEYYSSQSYAKKEQLFLIRMVTAGQYNLENYLLELENAFNAFEEEFGNPDVRVMALSLRDDIFQIPYKKNNGDELRDDERVNQFRARLKDVKLLDSRGYLTLPFSTQLKDLSPLTRNHKIRHVEVELQGGQLGDGVARIYLRMSGTGVVKNVADATDYYVFPERTAVVNASIGGSKVFDPEVYRNYRFRDRPLVNTLWELIINQRDELANRDMNLGTLNDIRVLIYYSDFTTF
ncbi:MAG: hypothetical protein ABTQ32_26065 [Myxococcaceae bacterium]